jgi:hypothetical protein
LNGEFKKNHEEIKNIMMYIRVWYWKWKGILDDYNNWRDINRFAVDIVGENKKFGFWYIPIFWESYYQFLIFFRKYYSDINDLASKKMKLP